MDIIKTIEAAGYIKVGLKGLTGTLLRKGTQELFVSPKGDVFWKEVTEKKDSWGSHYKTVTRVHRNTAGEFNLPKLRVMAGGIEIYPGNFTGI